MSQKIVFSILLCLTNSAYLTTQDFTHNKKRLTFHPQVLAIINNQNEQALSERKKMLEAYPEFKNAFEVAYLGFLATQTMKPEDKQDLLKGLRLTIQKLQSELKSN